MSKSTWKSNPTNNEWNNADNWTSDGVPSDEAIFSSSEKTGVTFEPKSESTVNIVSFDKDASAFVFTIGNSPEHTALTISEGVVNNSQHTQTFAVKSNGASYKTPQMKFTNKASAGDHTMMYQAGPTSLEEGFGGGIIAFEDDATAGSASFVARTGAQTPPKDQPSTVGAEISFSDRSTAGKGLFKSYGTLKPPTGAVDTDTFGNIVFHDETSADHGTFISAGGTYGDGGNTQFYDSSNAANGTFINYGGTMDKANGGDCVFDGNANGGNGTYTNYAATAIGGFGGVVSFNNNPPRVAQGGSSAGNGVYTNYGATTANSDGTGAGGGHIEFSALHGSPTADHGTFHNYGSVASNSSSAGHTIFSINTPTEFFPSAGNANIYNHPAKSAKGSAGYTEFAVYKSKSYSDSNSNSASVSQSEQTVFPTAENATIHNIGGTAQGMAGGYVTFSGKSKAANANLIAYAGTHGGDGGRIVFQDDVDGGEASVSLYGNGILDISYYSGTLTIASLSAQAGTIITQTGEYLTTLALSQELKIGSGALSFSFPASGGKFEYDTKYTILKAENLSDFDWNQFQWSGLDNGVKAYFEIDEDTLMVSFSKE